MRRVLTTFVFVSLLAVAPAFAQDDTPPLRIFGYFQSTFDHQTTHLGIESKNTFLVQQLNLFLQKDISRSWRALVSFEAINSFSSQRNWGGLSIAEAWVAYRYSRKFNLKLGLQIPTFNHLNEIKNRTPLLPYVVRPLMYESSFAEDIDIDLAVPHQAFIQAYGYLPQGRTKWDYAFYVGNSPNIQSVPNRGRRGEDTSKTVLLGGRVGIRNGDWKAGVSGTYDQVDALFRTPDFGTLKIPNQMKLDRYRLGFDVSTRLGPIVWESEYIFIDYEDPIKGAQTDALFVYGTLGVNVTDRLFTYVSVWIADFTLVKFSGVSDAPGFTAEPVEFGEEENIDVATIGGSFNINDRTVIKAQIAQVWIDGISYGTPVYTYDTDWQYYSTAVSVWF